MLPQSGELPASPETSMTALPPKPTHNFFPLRFSPALAVSENERRHMIEKSAFYRAEARGFAPGHESDDWRAAEAEVDARLAHMRSLTGILF